MAVAVTRPRAQGYGVLIGENYFRLAPSSVAPIQTYTQDSLAPRQDDAGKAGENVLEVGYAYGKQNMTGGEGLDWWPRPGGEERLADDITRFWDSANVNIRRPESGQPYQTVLTKQLESFWTPTSSPVDMGSSRDAVYVAEGQNVHRLDDWADNTPDDTDDLGAAVVMLDVGLDDTVIALLDDGDIHMKPDNSDSWVEVYDSATQGGDIQAIWWVKGRIIAARKDSAAAGTGEVLEIDPGIGGTPATPTSSSTVSAFDTYTGEMNAVIDAGHAIVAGFSDGSLRSYVPQTDSAGGTPVLTIRGRSNAPKGENPVALAWNLGQLLVFTYDEAPTGGNKVYRFYTGVVLDERFDYVVGSLQLHRTWQGTVETAPAFTKRIATSRDEAYFAVGEGTNDWSVWRFDFVTQGVFRHLKAERSAALGLTLFDGQLALLDGADVYVQSATTYASTGYVITPNITFGLNTPISWIAYVLEVLNLTTAGAKVELYYSINPEAIQDPDHSTWTLWTEYTDPSQSGVEQAAINIEANQLAMQVKWHRSDDGLVSPNLKRFATRGIPTHVDWIIEMPINVSDIVSAPGRMPLRVPGLGDTTHSTLLALQGKSRTCELYDPPVTIRGTVQRLAEPVTFITDRGSQGRYCMVRVLGKLVGTSIQTVVQGSAGMGIAQAGVSTMGIGEVE